MDAIRIMGKVLSGTATREEKSDLEQWTRQNPVNREEWEDFQLLEQYAHTIQRDTEEVPVGSWQEMKDAVFHQVMIKRWIRFGVITMIIAAGVGNMILTQPSDNQKPLYFNNATLADVIQMLEKQYDIQIQASEHSTPTCRLTATFYRLDKATTLQSIEQALNVRFLPLQKNKYKVAAWRCT